MTKTTEQFVSESKIIQESLGRSYDYSKVNYTNNKNKVEIICSKHGSFWQQPTTHLFGKAGCPHCAGNVKLTTIDMTQENIKEILNYDRKSGIFTWVNNRASLKSGDRAGTINSDGYVRIRINHKEYKAHRLAFLYEYGYMPEQVDHINHVRHDNRIKNLRASNDSINQKNTSHQKNNTSGRMGVSWSKAAKKWRAFIWHKGKQKHLGLFKHKDEAIEARKKSEFELGYHENHGMQLI